MTLGFILAKEEPVREIVIHEAAPVEENSEKDVITGSIEEAKPESPKEVVEETPKTPIVREALRLQKRLTEEGKRRFGLRGDRARVTVVHRESLAHEFWKNWYADYFESKGYSITVEAPRRQGRVDVLATRASESGAIEIETGKSDVVWNVKQDLLSGFQRVIVVATDEKALGKVERELGRAGLIVAGRVRVLMRDSYETSVF